MIFQVRIFKFLVYTWNSTFLLTSIRARTSMSYSGADGLQWYLKFKLESNSLSLCADWPGSFTVCGSKSQAWPPGHWQVCQPSGWLLYTVYQNIPKIYLIENITRMFIVRIYLDYFCWFTHVHPGWAGHVRVGSWRITMIFDVQACVKIAWVLICQFDGYAAPPGQVCQPWLLYTVQTNFAFILFEFLASQISHAHDPRWLGEMNQFCRVSFHSASFLLLFSFDYGMFGQCRNFIYLFCIFCQANNVDVAITAEVYGLFSLKFMGFVNTDAVLCITVATTKQSW